jgi:hypothetical protein
VIDKQTSEPLLTLDQAYVAAWFFIRQFYERDGMKPRSLFFLLEWMQLVGKRDSSDPAHWHDWLIAVETAVQRDGDDFRFPPVSPPLS